MSKRAVILHGTDNTPNDVWYPWVQQQLESEGYQVFFPVLPNNHIPDRRVYDEFLRNSGWDFSNNIIVGHSSGSTTVLNLLAADWMPKIKAAVLTATFLNENHVSSAEWYDPGQFDNLFPEKFDTELIKTKADAFIFVHGSDDIYCDINDAKTLCNELGGSFVTIENGGHLSFSSGRDSLPELMEALGPYL